MSYLAMTRVEACGNTNEIDNGREAIQVDHRKDDRDQKKSEKTSNRTVSLLPVGRDIIEKFDCQFIAEEAGCIGWKGS